MRGNETVVLPLQECVEKCREVARGLAACDFARVRSLRCVAHRELIVVWQRYLRHQLRAQAAQAGDALVGGSSRRVALLTCGAPAPGMSACVASLVRLLRTRGVAPLGVRDGFAGLAATDAECSVLTWHAARDMMALGGSALSCNRRVAGRDVPMAAVADGVRRLQLDALIVIGGFEAYTSIDGRFFFFFLLLFFLKKNFSKLFLCDCSNACFSLGI